MWPKRIARVCLNMLRSRSLRGEESPGVHLPDPLVSPDAELQPEGGGVPSDSAGLALLAVLDTLAPAERLAFVLHDMFELSPSAAAPDCRLPRASGYRRAAGRFCASACAVTGGHRASARPSPDRGPVSRVRVWVTAVAAGS